MRTILILAVLLIGCGAACGQETHSVLVNPPATVPQVQAPLPQQLFLIKRGFFGRRYLYPVVVKQPVVVWTPVVIWK